MHVPSCFPSAFIQEAGKYVSKPESDFVSISTLGSHVGVDRILSHTQQTFMHLTEPNRPY